MKKPGLLIIAMFIGTMVWSQNRIPMIGESAPSFEANTTNGKLEFPEDFGKSWKILFSHPKDLTPVCTSEILELAKMQNEFKNLGVKIAIISVDDLSTHFQWKQLMEDILKNDKDSVKIDFPFIDDSNAKVSNKYGMIHAWENPTRDVRGVFIIDPDNVIQTINFYPMNIGRNIEEIKRSIVALQTSKEDHVLIPVNWKLGDDVLMPYVPYSESELVQNPELKNQYYKVGVNMWYKKETGN
jgi:peroxiredoxin (alkyl hydroperoxide reductase subunit C)